MRRGSGGERRASSVERRASRRGEGEGEGETKSRVPRHPAELTCTSRCPCWRRRRAHVAARDSSKRLAAGRCDATPLDARRRAARAGGACAQPKLAQAVVEPEAAAARATAAAALEHTRPHLEGQGAPSATAKLNGLRPIAPPLSASQWAPPAAGRQRPAPTSASLPRCSSTCSRPAGRGTRPSPKAKSSRQPDARCAEPDARCAGPRPPSTTPPAPSARAVQRGTKQRRRRQSAPRQGRYKHRARLWVRRRRPHLSRSRRSHHSASLTPRDTL